MNITGTCRVFYFVHWFNQIFQSQEYQINKQHYFEETKQWLFNFFSIITIISILNIILYNYETNNENFGKIQRVILEKLE